MKMECEAAVSINVMTVNIHKGFTAFNRRFMLPELRDAVRKVGCDLVFLQEVQGTHVSHAARVANWQNEPHYEFLADTMWPQFAYGRNAVYTHGHHGNAILSKFPILRYENHDVSVAGPEKRGILHCVVEVPGERGELHAICVHLGLRESHRRVQTERLCELLRGIPRNAPVIVAGDFNDWRERVHGALEKIGLHEIFRRANGRAARTFPARWPVLPLDRIYVRNAQTCAPVALSIRPWAHLSDHSPLVAQLQL